eukprot:1181110-Prorocentrum_minimum.AAC.3
MITDLESRPLCRVTSPRQCSRAASLIVIASSSPEVSKKQCSVHAPHGHGRHTDVVWGMALILGAFLGGIKAKGIKGLSHRLVVEVEHERDCEGKHRKVDAVSRVLMQAASKLTANNQPQIIGRRIGFSGGGVAQQGLNYLGQGLDPGVHGPHQPRHVLLHLGR